MAEAPQNKERAAAADSGRRSPARFGAAIKAEGRPLLEISRRDMIRAMRAVGPLADDSAESLAIPERLYTKDGQAYSSSRDSDPAAVSKSLLLSTPFPEAVPEYSLHLFGRGGSTYCVLVDSKRKVIVMGRVNQMQAESGSWGQFMTDLSLALGESQRLQAEGTGFRFVLSENGLIRRL